MDGIGYNYDDDYDDYDDYDDGNCGNHSCDVCCFYV